MFSNANQAFRRREPTLNFDHYKKFAESVRNGDISANKQQLYFGFETAILDKFKNVDSALIRFKDAPEYSVTCPCKNRGACDMCEDGQIPFKKVLEMLGTEDEHLLSHAIWKLSAFSRYVQAVLDAESGPDALEAVAPFADECALQTTDWRRLFTYQFVHVDACVEINQCVGCTSMA